MSDDAERDAYWRLYKEHCDHMRHHETQRSTVAASMIAIASALVGVTTFDKEVTASDLPLLFIIVALGVFGTVFSAKQWERSSMHMERARAYRDAVDAGLAGKPINLLKSAADGRHQANFPTLSKLRIHAFWFALYLFVGTIGASLAILAIFSPLDMEDLDPSAQIRSEPPNLVPAHGSHKMLDDKNGPR